MTYSLNQILRLWTDKVRNCHFSSCNPSLGHHRCILKWCLSNQKFVRQNTQTPQINLVGIVIVMVSRFDHLRWQVIKSSTHGFSPVVWCMDAPSEIRNLDLTMDTNEDVFWFDISVNDMLLVEVFQSCGHLCDVLSCFPFGEAVLATKMLVQFSLPSELKNKEYAFTIVEVTVKLENIWMPQIALNLNLSSDLPLNTTSMLNLVLVENFQRTNKSTASLPSKVYTTKFALPEWPANLEHAQVKLLRRCWLLVDRI